VGVYSRINSGSELDFQLERPRSNTMLGYKQRAFSEMETGDEPIIRAVQLTKKFQSGKTELIVFSEVDFEVNRGERLALIGESGAGKSTLLYLIGGLDRPSNGKLYFGHRDISGLSEAELSEFRNREVGFVWQNHSLLPEFTALENVTMPLLIRGLASSEATSVSLARLDEVGLLDRASHRAGELSGGEQQRVALARALAGNPKILLADEPTGNLDFRTGEMIISLLDRLHRARHLTSIIVTHNITFAARCDRILQLDKGALVPWTGEGVPLQPVPKDEIMWKDGGDYV